MAENEVVKVEGDDELAPILLRLTVWQKRRLEKEAERRCLTTAGCLRTLLFGPGGPLYVEAGSEAVGAADAKLA